MNVHTTHKLERVSVFSTDLLPAIDATCPVTVVFVGPDFALLDVTYEQRGKLIKAGVEYVIEDKT